MTLKEALRFANNLKHNYTIDFNDMDKFCDIALKSIVMQIPKKPFHDDAVGVPNGCNSCGNLLLPEDNFCPICGQAIDWEDDL